ncbi:MAG: pilin [Vibrionaceae bacterium]
MRKQSGFSLIELMIVVAVIGVLTAIALPAYQNYTKKAELGAALASINGIKTNIEDYIVTYGAFPTTGDTAVSASNTVTFTQLGLAKNAFKYGSWTAEPIASGATATTGELAVTFNSTSAVGDTSKLSIRRSDSGRWSCFVSIAGTGASAAKSILPNGCAAE